MRLTEEGMAVCESCGCDTFTAPQVKENDEGGSDVFMCCKNCSRPVYVFHEDDPGGIEMLSSFFAAQQEEA